MKDLPLVRIQYGWLLADAASTVMNEKWGDGTPLHSFEYYEAIANKYAKWWSEDGESILEHLCEITGLSFYQNTIDVYVAPWFYAFSVPMVLGVVFKSKDELVVVLTHEIIHRLLTDNTAHDYEFNYLKPWRKMFGKEVSRNTLVHIPVHAIMMKLFTDVMKRPDLIELDRRQVSKYPDYAAAWKYVDENGHDAIIEKLRTI